MQIANKNKIFDDLNYIFKSKDGEEPLCFELFTEKNNAENFLINVQVLIKAPIHEAHLFAQNKEGIPFIEWLMLNDNGPDIKDTFIRTAFYNIFAEYRLPKNIEELAEFNERVNEEFVKVLYGLASKDLQSDVDSFNKELKPLDFGNLLENEIDKAKALDLLDSFYKKNEISYCNSNSARGMIPYFIPMINILEKIAALGSRNNNLLKNFTMHKLEEDKKDYSEKIVKKTFEYLNDDLARSAIISIASYGYKTGELKWVMREKDEDKIVNGISTKILVHCLSYYYNKIVTNIFYNEDKIKNRYNVLENSMKEKIEEKQIKKTNKI